MDATVKAAWVAALRDGHFRKGKYGLRNLDERYDAQGVLCELAVRAGIIAEPKRYAKPEAEVFEGYTYDGEAVGLSKKVCEWAGIDYRIGFQIGLMGDEGKSFDKIADWIEENL